MRDIYTYVSKCDVGMCFADANFSEPIEGLECFEL